MNNSKKIHIGPKTISIPKEWCADCLSGITIRLASGISKSQNSKDEGVPVTRIETISDGSINYEKIGYVDINSKECSEYKLRSGDVLFSNINSIPHIGKVAQYEGEEELYHGMNLLLLRFDNGKVVDKYAYYFLNSKLARDYWVSNCKQAVNQASLNQSDVGSVNVILPPLPEQKKIAEILSTVDEAIEKTDEIIETIKQLKKGLMQDLLTKGIGHDKFKKVQLGPKKEVIPKKWNTGKIEDYFEVSAGSDLDKDAYSEKQDEEHPYPVYSNSLENSGLYGYSSKFDYPSGGITITGRGSLGVANYRENKFNAIVRLIVLVPKNDNNLDSKFITEYINHKVDFWNESTGVPQLTRPQVFKKTICLPPLLEQKKIASILSSVDEKIQKEQEYKQKLQELKKGLMQDLLTGKVRVNHLID